MTNEEENNMNKKRIAKMTNLEPLTVKPCESLKVSLNDHVKVELRVTSLGQPEIYCDHTHILRLFRDWYEPNETC